MTDTRVPYIRLTRQDWQFICDAIWYFARNGHGSDLQAIRELHNRLQPHYQAEGIVISVTDKATEMSMEGMKKIMGYGPND